MEGKDADVKPARHLPSVDKVLRTPAGQALAERFGHTATVGAVREALSGARANGSNAMPEHEVAAHAGLALEAAQAPRLKSVFNLTGTILHTNLGRALIAEEAIKAATEAMRNAVTLEFDIDRGQRGERDDIVRDLICELTGAEDATLVNNNAAAVLLALNTLSEGREAIVSRGELIEIGGAFRMPEIMRRAGAILVEVGTTNRTHKRDYENAITAETGVILKVHTSNYRIEGFTAEVPARELAELARARNVPLVDDLGSGTLLDLTPFGLSEETTVAQAVAAGAGLVTFSGDKLLGGPQAGFIVGDRELIARINKNPMKRALRVDKIRLAAIEATLRLYKNPEQLVEKLPTYRLLARSKADIAATADRLQPQLAALLAPHVTLSVVACASQVGSGAMPVETLPSAALALQVTDGGGRALEHLAERLRALPVPVIGRIAQNAVLLDLRCLEDEAEFISNFKAFSWEPQPSHSLGARP